MFNSLESKKYFLSSKGLKVRKLEIAFLVLSAFQGSHKVPISIRFKSEPCPNAQDGLIKLAYRHKPQIIRWEPEQHEKRSFELTFRFQEELLPQTHP